MINVKPFIATTKNNTRTKLSLVILTMMFSINVFIPLLCHLDIATSTGTEEVWYELDCYDGDIKNITTSNEKFLYLCEKKTPRTAMATSVQIKFRIVIDTILHTHVCNPTPRPSHFHGYLLFVAARLATKSDKLQSFCSLCLWCTWWLFLKEDSSCIKRTLYADLSTSSQSIPREIQLGCVCAAAAKLFLFQIVVSIFEKVKRKKVRERSTWTEFRIFFDSTIPRHFETRRKSIDCLSFFYFIFFWSEYSLTGREKEREKNTRYEWLNIKQIAIKVTSFSLGFWGE